MILPVRNATATARNYDMMIQYDDELTFLKAVKGLKCGS